MLGSFFSPSSARCRSPSRLRRESPSSDRRLLPLAVTARGLPKLCDDATDVTATCDRSRRDVPEPVRPKRPDEEPDDSQFVYFVPPKHEAVSYSVEAVLDSKLVGRKVLYLVKWEGFDDEADNTWEPEKNLDDCPEKLERYWKAAPDSVGAKRHAEEMEKERVKRRRLSAAKGEPPPPPEP